jgi:hypothetical protein
MYGLVHGPLDDYLGHFSIPSRARDKVYGKSLDRSLERYRVVFLARALPWYSRRFDKINLRTIVPVFAWLTTEYKLMYSKATKNGSPSI